MQWSQMHDKSFIIVMLCPRQAPGPWRWLDPSLPSSKPSLMFWHHRRLQVPLGLLGPQLWRCLLLSEEPCSETEIEKWPHPSPQFTEAPCRGHGSNLDCPCIWVAREKHIYFHQLKLSISFCYKCRGQAAAERAVSALIGFSACKAGWAEVFKGHLCSPRFPNHSN